MLAGAVDRDVVARIGVAHHAGRRIVPQHALDPARGFGRAVGDDHHAGMLREAHADAAAMVQATPRSRRSRQLSSALSSGQSDTASEPSRIASVSRFGRRDRAGIEMIAADHDRRLQFAARDHLVEREAEPVALAEADPADARRQALEVDALARHVEPVVQMRVVGQQFLHLGVGLVDVFRIARQRGPAERPDAAAEQRADIGRHEAREVERVRARLRPCAIWRMLLP